jgi:SAM-dependent methyltransferase
MARRPGETSTQALAQQRNVPKLTVDLLAGLPKNGPTDPIEFYRRPLVGSIFRERINMGLRLLGDARFERVLEVGFGAGAVLLALAPASAELYGIDLDASPEVVRAILAARGIDANLRKGDVCELPYANDFFDLVVSYSVFEHLREYVRALGEVARVLRRGGRFLIGMPAVNKAMEWGFRAIGFKGIADHHVATPAEVSRSFEKAGFDVVAQNQLGLRRIPGAAVYYTWLLEKTRGPVMRT